MSLPPPNNLLSVDEATAANNNQNINSVMINSTANDVGKTFSKFDPTRKEFGLELTAANIKNIIKNKGACSCSVKAMDDITQALYRAQFGIKIAENGSAVVETTIRRELDFEKNTVNATSYYFVVNGNSKMYDDTIPASVFADVIGTNGVLEVICVLNDSNEDEAENHFGADLLELERDAFENLELPDVM